MNQERYILECESKIHVIIIQEINYVNKMQLATELHTTTDRIICNKSIKEILQQLPNNFLRINRNQIINLFQVKTLIKQNHEVILKSGIILHASQRCFPLIVRALKQEFLSLKA